MRGVLLCAYERRADLLTAFLHLACALICAASSPHVNHRKTLPSPPLTGLLLQPV